MSKKKAKDKKARPLPKPNRQIPNSMLRPLAGAVANEFLQNARQYPLRGCWVMEGWKEEGITPVVVARQQEPDRVMFGVYMVDYYCLGVKDVYTRSDYSISRFERDLTDMCGGSPVQCTAELAHELIYGAIEYARSLGFQPHPDFTKQMADLMLDPPDAHPRTNQVEFGKDGKPLYISGPFESELQSRSIVNTLMRTRGEGNFDYIVGIGDISEE